MLNRGSNSGSNDLPEQVNPTTSKHDSNSPHKNPTGNHAIAPSVSEKQSVASSDTPITPNPYSVIGSKITDSPSQSETSGTASSLLHFTGVLGRGSKNGNNDMPEQEESNASKNESSSSSKDNAVNPVSSPIIAETHPASSNTPITNETDGETTPMCSDSEKRSDILGAVPSLSDSIPSSKDNENGDDSSKTTKSNRQVEKVNTSSFSSDTLGKSIPNESESNDYSHGSPKNSQPAATNSFPHPRERVKNDAEGHIKSEPVSDNADESETRPNLADIGAGVAVVGGVVTVGGMIVGSTVVTALGITAVVVGGTCYLLEGK